MAISKLDRLLELALKQGEGFGTAYEYYVKLHLLRKFFAKTDCQPKSILIAGLPEKYGYSLDIALLSQDLNAELTVLDDREDCLDKFTKLSQELGILDVEHCKLVSVSDWANLSLNKEYDLIVSCEVLQRLNDSQRISYVRDLALMAKCLAIFTPNSGNRSHTKLSRLNSLSIQELIAFISKTDLHVFDTDYLDAPPFPSGVKINRDTHQNQQYNKYFHKAMIVLLSTWTRVERICPRLIMKRFSHIVYILATRKPEL